MDISSAKKEHGDIILNYLRLLCRRRFFRKTRFCKAKERS